jgi:hypothetical protein
MPDLISEFDILSSNSLVARACGWGRASATDAAMKGCGSNLKIVTKSRSGVPDPVLFPKLMEKLFQA